MEFYVREGKAIAVLLVFFACTVCANERTVDFEVNLAERVPLIGILPEPHKVSLMLTTYVEHGRIHKLGGFILDIGWQSFTVPQCLARNIYSQSPADLRVFFYLLLDNKKEAMLDLDFYEPRTEKKIRANPIRFRFSVEPLMLKAIYVGEIDTVLSEVPLNHYCEPMELNLLYPTQRLN